MFHYIFHFNFSIKKIFVKFTIAEKLWYVDQMHSTIIIFTCKNVQNNVQNKNMALSKRVTNSYTLHECNDYQTHFECVIYSRAISLGTITTFSGWIFSKIRKTISRVVMRQWNTLCASQPWKYLLNFTRNAELFEKFTWSNF